MNKINKIK